MAIFYIKKVIKANTIMAALRNEKKAEIVDVYQMAEPEVREGVSAIGFNAENTSIDQESIWEDKTQKKFKAHTRKNKGI